MLSEDDDVADLYGFDYSLIEMLLAVVPARIELPVTSTQAKPYQRKRKAIIARSTMGKKLIFDLLNRTPVFVLTRLHQLSGDVFSDFSGIIAADTQPLLLLIERRRYQHTPTSGQHTIALNVSFFINALAKALLDMRIQTIFDTSK